MFNKKKKIIVKIEGMRCEHCATKVENIINNIDGVLKANVDLKKKQATVLASKQIDSELIKKEIDKLDYKVIDVIE